MSRAESIERSPLQVNVDPGLKKKIIEVAKREGISQSEVLRRSFVYYYASQVKGGGNA